MRALLQGYAYMCTARASFGGKLRISCFFARPLARHFFGELAKLFDSGSEHKSLSCASDVRRALKHTAVPVHMVYCLSVCSRCNLPSEPYVTVSRHTALPQTSPLICH
jgi:hypothetical protein